MTRPPAVCQPMCGQCRHPLPKGQGPHSSKTRFRREVPTCQESSSCSTGWALEHLPQDCEWSLGLAVNIFSIGRLLHQTWNKLGTRFFSQRQSYLDKAKDLQCRLSEFTSRAWLRNLRQSRCRRLPSAMSRSIERDQVQRQWQCKWRRLGDLAWKASGE